jgi:1-acyl-sn-glycerol-3-phosphate acyltransferase
VYWRVVASLATMPAAATAPVEEPEPPPLSRLGLLVAAIRSTLAYVIVSAYVLLVAPPGMLLALLFGWVDVLYLLGHGGVIVATWLVGIRYRIAGTEHLPKRSALFVSNHQSNIDPPILFRVLHPRLHFVYKSELQAIPILARAFNIAGFIPIERRNREQALAALDQGAAALQAGTSFLMFPEGTRSRTGALLPFKKGGFIMAITAQAPIVPVAISGARAAMRKGSWIVRPVTISVRVGQPVETAGLTPEQRDAAVDEIRNRIEEMLEKGPVADQNTEYRIQNTE